ncbi:stomatin family protein/prohibitin-family membrane protease subunit ybbk [Tupanvirus deep ocean]|uniref:Stomatin family protein/prohibitin-family membrane protease subunit ybbk n=2 Tax=Tupanvirus TaxID=2094720 RepID=A0AC62A6Y7_9VIRU|nr:stomatin family protein/prohibitin-family membrane protease subunit ybbk [Tupanvirus deep ocean]QKU33489.1 stomatin family protein/prohibitin-family membrane protease subunit ybbk [Tupanvirus deep ocean]
MEERIQLVTEYSSKSYSSIDNDEDYHEPCFASFLRALGCCFGYLCIPMFGGFCGACCYPYKSVNKGSRGVIQEFGRVKREVGDGMHYVNPITEKMTTVNMKVQVIDLDKQDVMTSDKLSISIDSIVMYKVTNVNDALFRIDDVRHSIVELAHTTLRNVIGNSTLETCLSKREDLATSIKQIVDEAVHDWGVKIMSIQIKDIRVPQNITNSLSSAVTTEREAQAKIITAEADVKAAEMMRKAADILSTPAAMQIRSLEVIDRMAQNQNTKIVILPADLSLQTNIPSSLVTKEIVNV